MVFRIIFQKWKDAAQAKKRLMPQRTENITVLDIGMALGNCPNCKTGVNSESEFCHKCGQALVWIK